MSARSLFAIGWILGTVALSGTASAVTPTHANSASFKDSHISVELITDRATVEPGGAVKVGVQFSIEEGWHIYWKNPGQSGLPTRIAGAPIEGVSYDPVKWPLPSAFQFDGLVNYGYEQRPLFLQTVHFAKENRATPINISLPLTVSWVLCRDECIPGEATLSLNIENGAIPNSLVKPTQISGFSEGRSALLSVSGSVSNGELVLSIAGLNKGIQSAHYAPALTDLVDPGAVQKVEMTGVATPTVVVPLLPQPDPVPPVLDGVLFLSYTDGSSSSHEVVIASHSPSATASVSLLSLIGILASAFFGGLILNLMPCVFPVLSLKVASLVAHAHSGSSRNHMLVFVAGVLASFLSLAALLITLRMIGQGVGWGFQFQSPVFVSLMVILTFVLGLNLAGVFEVGLALQSKAGSVQVSEGYSGSFLSGVLATTLATPCTAPFMGSAVAYALAAPLWGVVAVFLALGLGMGSPFLVLAISPRLMKYLPRPGAWMESFKQALSFPMFATSVWLMSVLGAQEGTNSMTMCGFGLVILSVSVWQLGRWGALHQPVRVRRMSRAFGAAFAILGIWVAIPQGNDAEASQEIGLAESDHSIDAFTPARVKELQAQGRNVMVDFTAAWCLVCKVNHARVLTAPSVTALLTEKNVTVLKADWTRRDPVITEALQELGKSGVPLIVLYPGNGGAPVQFEGLLSSGEFETTLMSLP